MNHRLLVCLAVCAAVPAMGAQVDYSARAGVALSDNVMRSAPGTERSSTAAVAGLQLYGSQPTGRLRYDLSTDLAYYHYLSPDISGEVFGRALARGAYDFVPDTFSWNASLNYDQLSADTYGPIAPGNVEGVTTFSTGPTLRARFSSVMEGQLDGHYVRTSYDDRPFDNRTVGASAVLARRANPRSTLAAGVSYDDVSYLSSLGAGGLDYQRLEYFGRLQLEGARTRIALDAGYADISGTGFSSGGALLRAHVNRRVTPFLSVFANGVREYPTSEDSGLAFDLAVPGSGSADSGLLTAGPRLSTSYEAGVAFASTRAQAEVVYLRRKESSVLAGVGARNYDEVRARVTRNFTPRVRGALFASYGKEDFSLADAWDEKLFGGELGISFGRALGLDLRVERRDRDGATRAQGYSEVAGGIYLRYASQGGMERR